MSGTRRELLESLGRTPLLLDGATGTELERRGVSGSVPLWSAGALLTAPDVVAAVHRDYVLAGADILIANTFRTNPRTLEQAGLRDRGAELNARAVALARQATAGRDVLVAASVAPVGDCYCPERVPPDAELTAEHARMIAWLAVAEPDLIWIETMNCAREARIAAMTAGAARLPFVVSFVVQESGDLLSGDRLEDAVRGIEPFAPAAIGLNCIPPRGVTALLPRLRRATVLPLVAYAHIANPAPIRGWSYAEDCTPAEYAAYAAQWLELGVMVVGGCCGTTAAHIKAVRGVLDNQPPPRCNPPAASPV